METIIIFIVIFVVILFVGSAFSKRKNSQMEDNNNNTGTPQPGSRQTGSHRDDHASGRAKKSVDDEYQ
jgi:predicted secreted protein